MKNYDVIASKEVRIGNMANDAIWSESQIAQVNQFHPKSSDHRPVVSARMLAGCDAIYLRFDVQDRYVKCVAQHHQESVCTDSCVEAFLEPFLGAGYFNFELSAIGTMLVYFIEDAQRIPGGFKKYTVLPPEIYGQVTIQSSLTQPVLTEITEPVNWWLVARIPHAVFNAYTRRPVQESSHWRGNFYKCADRTSHPHWASWSPIADELNFHQPAFFGDLLFR